MIKAERGENNSGSTMVLSLIQNGRFTIANIGDSRSLAIHPASTTHSQLSDTDMKAAGVSPSYVRLSIGLEHVDDIIADISNALDAA